VRILITGASGFIGSHLGKRLAERHDVLGIVFRAARTPSFRCVSTDLTDERAVAETLRNFAPQVIVHAAAMSRVIECEDRPDDATAINVTATARLVRWAERLDAKLVFISSDQVFSGRKGGRRESDVPDPVSRYGRTKLEAERYVLASSARSLVVRANSVVGPSLGWGESFTDMVMAKLRRGESVVLFEDQFRSPIHIRSMTDVLEAACVHDLSGLVHAGGLARLSRLDAGYALARAYALNPDRISPGSYRSHPRANIMTADTSYDVSRLLQVVPALRLRPLDDEFAADAGHAESRHALD
jgi:dTDP-4-dehydrorhamnose reductase